MKGELLLRRIPFALLAFSFVSGAWPIARHPGDIGVPVGLINATVRVRAIGFGLGTGTVIDVKPDASGPGGWLCVLTADHVVGHGTDGWQVGFGNGTGAGPWQYNAPLMFRGPFDPAGGTWVDLALLGVRVNDLTTLPALTMPTPAAPVTPGVIQKGFGDTGTIGAPREYDIVAGFGTYRNGRNTIDATPIKEIGDPATGKNYRYVSLEGDLDFFPPAPGAWPPDAGESHFLSGDSGGPTVQQDPSSGQWLLVGVHSASQTNVGYTRVVEGSLWWDVRVGSYLNWVESSCAAVPEPASLVAVLAGVLSVMVGRRRRARGN